MPQIDPTIITVLMFGGMVVLMVMGAPLVYCLSIVAMAASILLWGVSGSEMAVVSMFGLMNTFVLVALPLFIFMGLILESSGIADDLFNMFYKLMGGLNGGLAMGAVIICAIIAAMAGVSGAATVSLGIIALPAMLKRGYDKRLVTGTIMAGGALGFLIPPSCMFIFYAYLARLSAGKLLAAGMIPGIMLAVIYILWIGIICHLQPHLGPAIPVSERVDFRGKLQSLKAMILPGILIFSVLGFMYMGITSATEAAAIGAFGSMVCAAAKRNLTWLVLRRALMNCTKVMGMLLWIGVGAAFFSKIYLGLGAQQMVQNFMTHVQLGPYGVLTIILLTYFVLGCFLDDTAILFLTVPLYVPIIRDLGFDPIWFGVLFVVSMQTAYLTPPFGYNLFYMRGVAPPEITTLDLYRAVVPFIILQTIGLILIILFPQIALWLPNLLFGK
ncbi:MAG: TRAP transporter large permease subunit [Deltaproteobacteria bacterium]|nr:TRAP transporter large permease subunit [Deltaproteobacteria bacterium]